MTAPRKPRSVSAGSEDGAAAVPAPKRLSGRQRTQARPDPVPGDVSRCVAELVASLGSLDAGQAVLAAAAGALALELDSGAGMAAAAAVRELRATVAELTGGGDVDDDFSRWEANLGSA